ncbi:MAG: AAA-like domain-containing protein [Calothrix sp. MO_167.B12]|nr:AAA-like domain-containing protein [Calothrix sp. MO_167.B12]
MIFQNDFGRDQRKHRRKRGVILTTQGSQKLFAARSQTELEENSGKRYTLEAMSDRTGLSVDTIMKVLKCESGVDKQSLKSFFQAFGLKLEKDDYDFPQSQGDQVPQPPFNPKPPPEVPPEFPEGQVPLNSLFYLERPLIDTKCYELILQPGVLLRIKAPRRMGKSSLIARIIHQGDLQKYKTVYVRFYMAEKAVFQSLDTFLQWFCASITVELGLPKRLGDYWDELFGSNISCKIYFEQYLLQQIAEPIVLGLDDVDCLFQYPNLADEFFGLLRTWHEEGKNRQIWQKLRLVVAHSAEVYIPLNINRSPFNVGVPIELPPFTQEQVQDLCQRHKLDWSNQKVKALTELVGGNPYLIRLALYHIYHQRVTLEQVLQTSLTSPGIYSDRLQAQLMSLEQEPELLLALSQVVNSQTPVELELVTACKLQSMGLVHLQGNKASVSCKLYLNYFRDRLS